MLGKWQRAWKGIIRGLRVRGFWDLGERVFGILCGGIGFLGEGVHGLKLFMGNERSILWGTGSF